MGRNSEDRAEAPETNDSETRDFAAAVEQGNEGANPVSLMRDIYAEENLLEDPNGGRSVITHQPDEKSSVHASHELHRNRAKLSAESRSAVDPSSLPSLRSTKDSLASAHHTSHHSWAPYDPETGEIKLPPPRELDLPPPSFHVTPTNISNPIDYHAFYWECMELKSELIRLDFALRSIGSAGPLIKATHDVKRASMRLRDLYGMNTSALFPENENVKMYSTSGSFAYLSKFSIVFNEVGDALNGFAHALHNFKNVYHDERLMLQLFSLHGRFKAEAFAISLHQDTGKSLDGSDVTNKEHMAAPDFSQARALAERIQSMISEWLRDAMKTLTEAILSFIDKGIPIILKAQKNTSIRYLNLTTIAFFLSGTTASMLQVTAGIGDSALGAAVNSCLFSSLVFSVGSAVNSLLARGWRNSVVRDPDSALSVGLKVWLNAGPMISLLISGAFFAVGICAFVFTPGQHSWTAAITVVFTTLHASGLLFLFGIFIQERWIFRRDGGAVGKSLTEQSLLLSGMEWANSCFVGIKQTRRAGTRNIGADKLEEGTEIGPKFMMMPTASTSSGPEKHTQSPGMVYHALSDERFILPSKFVAHRTHPLPTIVRLSRSRSRPPTIPQRYSGRLHYHSRAPTIGDAPPSPASVTPPRGRSPPVEGRRPRRPANRWANTHQPFGSAPSKRTSIHTSESMPPLEPATANVPSDYPGRVGDVGAESRHDSNMLELPAESDSQQRITSSASVMSWDPDRVYTDDDDEEWDEILDQEGGNGMPAQSPPQLLPQPCIVPDIPSAIPSRSSSIQRVWLADRPRPIVVHPPKSRSVRSPSLVDGFRIRRQRDDQVMMSPTSTYGNVRSAAMFLPNTMHHPVLPHQRPTR